MAIRAIKNEHRCKICRSSERPAIDALLELRARAMKDDSGDRVTLSTVLAAMTAAGIDNPTKENVTLHFRNHCQLIDGKTQADIDAALEGTLAKLDDGVKVDPDHALDRIVALGMAEIEEKVAAGQRSGIPPDLVLKAIQVKTQRRSSEAQSDLLRAVGGGIAQALASRPQPELEAPADPDVVEDAEFVEVEA